MAELVGPVVAWHFLPNDGKLRYDDGREPKKGERLRALPVGHGGQAFYDRICLCSNGMHASRALFNALEFAPGCILCRVLVEEEILSGEDKLAGRYRTILEMANVEKDLRILLHDLVERIFVHNPHVYTAQAISYYTSRLQPVVLGRRRTVQSGLWADLHRDDCPYFGVIELLRMWWTAGPVIPRVLIRVLKDYGNGENDQEWLSGRLAKIAKDHDLKKSDPK